MKQIKLIRRLQGEWFYASLFEVVPAYKEHSLIGIALDANTGEFYIYESSLFKVIDSFIFKTQLSSLEVRMLEAINIIGYTLIVEFALNHNPIVCSKCGVPNEYVTAVPYTCTGCKMIDEWAQT